MSCRKHSSSTQDKPTRVCVLHCFLRCTMAVFLRRSLNGSRGALALAMPPRTPRSVRPLGRLMEARPWQRPTHSSIPVSTVVADAAPTATTTAAAADPAADSETTARALEQELFKVLCEPRPSNPLLVALVRALVQLGEQPSVEVVRAIARHFLDTRDTLGSKVSTTGLRSPSRDTNGLTVQLCSNVLRLEPYLLGCSCRLCSMQPLISTMPLELLCVHVDIQTSQQQRRKQLRNTCYLSTPGSTSTGIFRELYPYLRVGLFDIVNLKPQPSCR